MSVVVAFVMGVSVALWAASVAAQVFRRPTQLRRPLVYEGDTLRLEGRVYRIDGVILDGPHGVLVRAEVPTPGRVGWNMPYDGINRD